MAVFCLHYHDSNQYKFKLFCLQSTWRLWGEEKVEGAVFSVYLKKVTYLRKSTFNSMQ